MAESRQWRPSGPVSMFGFWTDFLQGKSIVVLPKNLPAAAKSRLSRFNSVKILEQKLPFPLAFIEVSAHYCYLASARSQSYSSIKSLSCNTRFLHLLNSFLLAPVLKYFCLLFNTEILALIILAFLLLPIRMALSSFTA